jgi:signal transduction histidine kinase
VEDVLALHRETAADAHGAGVDSSAGLHHDTVDRTRRLEQVLDEVTDRWHGQFAAVGRHLDHDCEPGTAGRTFPAVRVGQILDVLLDNALRHGAGQVRVTARSVGSATAIDIADEGVGIPPGSADVFRRGHGSGHGIGLGLAREFATSMGGRLILSTRTPPVFTLLLPAE